MKIIDFNPPKDKYIWLDFTDKNTELQSVDLTDTVVFSDYIFKKLATEGAKIGIGGYMEHRMIYRRSEHFNKAETDERCIHLGIDIWTMAGTPVYAPADGVVHSFQNNANFGDYGPTIVLEHTNFLNHQKIYTLYGHLSLDSLQGIFEGKTIREGEKIAEIGNFPINGDWPPHLHFQVMTDMWGMKGDFAGVCSIADQAKYQQICLNPNLILDFQ
jgi:murein DD-endopeptidase MepM/ murein hydrolase activator NlpD